jgi:hypothetical protein
MRKAKFNPPGIEWRPNRDGDGDQVRVWRSDWFGDEFEIMDRTEFFTIVAPAFLKLGFMVTRAEDD